MLWELETNSRLHRSYRIFQGGPYETDRAWRARSRSFSSSRCCDTLQREMQQNTSQAALHRSSTSDEVESSDEILGVTPVSPTIKAAAGRYWTFDGAQAPLTEASAAVAPKSAGWRTTQGLGLYVLSTVLLSTQATSAKVLGKCSDMCCKSYFHNDTGEKHLLFREAWS